MNRIGVFDSGIGGLTVLRALKQHLPEQDFIYLGDTARLPYGTKSGKTIRAYAEQNIRFLIEQNVDLVVIACNSASSHFTETNLDGIEVIGVVRSGCEAAMQATQNQRIGLIATRATVDSRAYHENLVRLGSKAELFANPAPLLVGLAEEGWIEDPITNLIIYRYVQPILQQSIDTLILGCTHFPLLRLGFEKTVGSAITLVDSGESLAKTLSARPTRALRNRPHAEPMAPAGPGEPGLPMGKIQFYSTDENALRSRWVGNLLADLGVAEIFWTNYHEKKLLWSPS